MMRPRERKNKNRPSDKAGTSTLQEEENKAPSAKYLPEMLIPFAYSREDAINACRDFYKNRWLLPEIFKKESHYEEMQGGFVPYFLYTGNAEAEITYEAQDSQEVSGDKKIKKQIREFEVRRKASAEYYRLQLDASKDVPEAFMHNIEPYKYKDLVPIKGTAEEAQLGDLSDFSIEEDAAIKKRRILDAVSPQIRKTVSHNYVKETHEELNIQEEKTECVLFPMWVLITKRWRRYYHFAMNGQTGQIYGDLPFSHLKAYAAFLGTVLAAGGAIYGFLRFVFLMFGTKQPPENSNMILVLIAIFGGMYASTKVMNFLFSQMRRPKQDQSGAARYESCKVNVTLKEDKLLRKQFVDSRNTVIREE